MNRFSLVAVGIVVLCTVCVPTVAQETTGSVIKEIIEQVDEKMTNLENFTEDVSITKSELVKDLAQEYERIKKADDPIEREDILSDMLVNVAKQNDMDLRLVRAYRDGINDILPMMERISDEIERAGNMGFESKEEVLKWQKSTRQFLQTMAVTCDTLRRSSTQDNLDKALAPAEHTIVGLYNLLTSPMKATATTTQEIARTINTLEEAYAQLTTIEKLLDAERLNLKIENALRLANWVFLRMFNGRLDLRSFNDVVADFTQGMFSRTTQYNEAARMCGGVEKYGSGSTPSRTESAALAKIRKGQI